MSDNDGGAVALVTGAGRGIGFEVSRQLAQRDMIVLLGVRNLEKGEAPIPEGAASVVWVSLPSPTTAQPAAFSATASPCRGSQDTRNHGRRTRSMKALGLAWPRIPAERFEPTVAFFRDVVGLEEERLEEDFAILRLPGGGAVEIFGPSRAGQEQFATGPIVGFRVEDVRGAREEMEAAGVEFIGPVHAGEGGAAWCHFRGPDGKTYEIMQLPDGELPE